MKWRSFHRRGVVAASGGGPSVTTTFSFVASTAIPRDAFHVRRGLVGGTLSRAWVSWEREGQRYVVSFRHEGSGANPVTWEPSVLTGANHAYCDLASGTRTAAQVATAFAVAAAGLDGGTWNVDSADVSSSGASAPLVSLDMDEDGQANRGKWGMHRDLGGWYDGTTDQGAMGATGGVHLPSPGTGRAIGLYIRADGGNNVRLGLGSGPAYSTDPAAITVLGEGVATAVDNHELGVVLFSEPIALAAATSYWFLFRGPGGQLLRFRYHGSVDTPGNGDLVTDEFLIWSALTGDPTVALGASVDLGGGGGPFGLYAHVGLIFELPDGGRYRNNAIRTWVGYQPSSPIGAPLSLTDPTDMVDETVTFRFPIPATLAAGQIEAIRIGVGTHTAGDDFGLALYDWDPADVGNFPSTSPATLLQSIGPAGVTTANAYAIHELASPQALAGIDAIAIAFNCGRAGGAAATSLQFIYDEDTGGVPGLNHWEDGRIWSDWVDDGSYGDPRSGGLQRTEYQTRASNGSTMPAGDPTAAWPNPFAVDSVVTADAAPLNVPRSAFLVVLPGITAVES